MNTCPKCGKTYTGRSAISREDNVTPICPVCGLKEAVKYMDVSEEEKQVIIDMAESENGVFLNEYEDFSYVDGDEYDYCFRTGNYTDQYCGICPHRYECSGYDGDD